MQFRFRCAAVLTAVLLCSAAALPALAEETATPETADSVSTYTGWKTVNGKDYWYENGVKQGTTGRGKEIYDPDSDAWHWLDANQGGAKAVSKDVYQESNGGKWVRYDANGHMIKGWDINDDGTYYFDLVTGAMTKGDATIDGLPCSFDTVTGIGLNCAWKRINGKDYWYEGGKREDVEYAGLYLGLNKAEGANWGVIRGGMSSVARLFVAQMQDYLGLGAEARMNVPGTAQGNWRWRMKPGEAGPKLAAKIRRYAAMYGRFWAPPEPEPAKPAKKKA